MAERPPLVAPADASWSATHRRSRTRYHWPSERDAGMAACGRYWLADDAACSPDAIAESLRCRLPACKRLYEAWDRERMEPSDA